MTGALLRPVNAQAGGKMRLTRELLKPYRGWLVVIAVEMLVETTMSLAAPWPLKVILDNVLGTPRRLSGSLFSWFIQNERYQDAVIIERLVRAVYRGVKIHVMTRPPHTLKKEKLVEGVGSIRILNDVGAKVHKLKHLKLHAKMLLADGKRAIVGSINLSPGSFDSRRELAIEVDDRHIVKRLHHVARHDWKHSHPLDLTDEELMADLEKRRGQGPEKLALNQTGKP
jgi:phosphatidylserine/phosphatidylglycerophosphate/cardiolipin synthase-like enzyme